MLFDTTLALPGGCGVVRCGHLATLQEAVVAHRLRLFVNTLSNNEHRIERLRRSRLHPRPERRGFTR